MQETSGRATEEEMLNHKFEALINNSRLQFEVLQKTLQEMRDIDLASYSDKEISNIHDAVYSDAAKLEQFEHSVEKLINNTVSKEDRFLVLVSKNSGISGNRHFDTYRKNIASLRPVFTSFYEVVDFMAQDAFDVQAMFFNSLPGFAMMSNASFLSRAINPNMEYASDVRGYGFLLMNMMGKNNIERFSQLNTQEIGRTFIKELQKIVARRMTDGHENDVKFLIALKAQPYNLTWIVNYAMSNTDLNLAEVVDCVYKVSTVMFSRTSNRVFTRLVQSGFPMSIQETKIMCENYHMIKDLDNDTIRSLYGTM